MTARTCVVLDTLDPGCISLVMQALLALDPALDARDRSGAGPLFCACYAGQAACVAELLAAGANAAMTNTQGESCLYIAALRGHAAVVDCLLQHLTAKGLPWMVRLWLDWACVV